VAGVDEMFELKPISAHAVPAAIRKAEHYRLLNEPEQAESICRDVLETDPGNQEALTVLALALTDRFGTDGAGVLVKQANAALAEVSDDYQRLYYEGLVCERRGRAMLARSTSRGFAYTHFRDALERYQQAELLRPDGDDAAVLRWNACVRTINDERLEPPRRDEGEAPLE
jgi:hypothetical protein